MSELRDQIAEKLNSTIVTVDDDLAPAADRFDRHDRHRFLHNCVVCRGDVAEITAVALAAVHEAGYRLMRPITPEEEAENAQW